jgi:pimeloyl-ACP methyl ester carboxylesterase
MHLHYYLHYPQFTTAAPLVLLHGFCEDSRIWDDILTRLPDNQPVVCIDIAGFGQSLLQQTWKVESMATEVKKVLEHLQIQECVLVGHSLGGYIALAFAEYYPEALLGLGLFHSHCYADSIEKQENRLKSIDFIQRNGTASFVKQLFYALFAPDFARANTALIEGLINEARKISPQAIIAASEAMIVRRDRSDVLQQLRVPLLLIAGKQDNVIPIEQSLAQACLADTTMLVLLDDVGHQGMIENPTETARALLNFYQFATKKPI